MWQPQIFSKTLGIALCIVSLYNIMLLFLTLFSICTVAMTRLLDVESITFSSANDIASSLILFPHTHSCTCFSISGSLSVFIGWLYPMFHFDTAWCQFTHA